MASFSTQSRRLLVICLAMIVAIGLLAKDDSTTAPLDVPPAAIEASPSTGMTVEQPKDFVNAKDGSGLVDDEFNTDANPVVDGQLKDENKVEAPLPAVNVSSLEIELNQTGRAFVNDDAASSIPITIGVLTAPALIRSRLIPLLESSLKYETDIHVFFMNSSATLSGRETLAEYLRQVQRTDHVHIVPLDPIRNMKMSLRNAWVNLPAIKYFRVARPQQKWFAIMDDDTYFLMNAVRRLLHEVDNNRTQHGKPVYMGTPLVDGVMGGCRVIRTGSQLRVQRTTIRKEVQFVCGGSGILLDRLTIEAMFIKNATGFDYVEQCIDTMFQGAGDVRLGHCLSELNVTILPRRAMFRDTMFRALGETHVHRKYDFPVSFHRFRKREWQYALRAVEDARGPKELVRWGDLLQNFQPGPVYWPSMFYPKKYENYTKIYGIRVMTPHEVRRNKIICKRFNCCRKDNPEIW